ncbi:MAG: GDSL-type esterase/lipase family protein [Planctomycetota bacterium]
MIASLLLLEGALQLGSAMSPQLAVLLGPPNARPATLPDPDVGVRLNPAHPDHDARGFRNREALAAADVVALGDSQTYGTNVARDRAWPQQLAARIGQPVYNMGVPGHGPVQARATLATALELQPTTVVYALYAGNDLYDAFTRAYADTAGVDARRSEDPAVLAEVRAAEAREPLADAVARAFTALYGAPETRAAPPPPGGLRGLLSRQSRLYGLVRAVRRGVRAPPTRHWAEIRATARAGQPLDTPNVRTILTPAYRLCALRLSDPRIAEGLRITLTDLAGMAATATATDTRFVVAFVPTKELVFADAAGPPRAPSWDELIEQETELWRRATAFLRTHDIDFVDLLPALRAAIAAGTPPYSQTADGHPNEAGHGAIATALGAVLE